MTIKFNPEALPIGLAMFSMFFGAGNVIFPLAIGQLAGDHNLYAILGLILTAAIMPIMGVVAMLLYDGSYKKFFGRLGTTPGFLLALTIISLLGPFGSTPRCIALCYTTLNSTFLDISPVIFSAAACVAIFFLSLNKNRLLAILGYVLTPFLLGSLILIILFGILFSNDPQPTDSTPITMFLHGFNEGYNMMDLLAAFFFSSTILNILRNQNSKTNHLHTAYQASIVGAILLSAIYVGFSYLAAYHGNDFPNHSKDELLAAITLKVAGPYGGLLVCFTVALACLTTAIALITSFTDFIQKEVFNNNTNYPTILAGSLLITFIISTFEFNGISAFLTPILQVTYPGLIVLTILNICHKLYQTKPIKIPVFTAFALTAITYA